jgi:two-component system cell cycle response regulator
LAQTSINGLMSTPTRLIVLQRPDQPLAFVCARLQAWGCDVRSCTSGGEALAAIATARTNLILIDVGAEDGMGLVAHVKADPDTRHLPAVAATIDDPATVAAYALALGADDIFALPIEDTELYARIRALSRLATLEIELRRREQVLAEFGVRAAHEVRGVPVIDRTGILLIGPAGGDQVQVMTALGGAATAAYAETAEAALERLRREDLDVAVITAGRDQDEMAHLCARIRSDSQLFDLPLLLIERPESFSDRTTPFRWGVSDVLFQPFHPEILRLRVSGWVRQQRLRRRLRDDFDDGGVPQTIDQLTSLYGHGFLHGYVDYQIRHRPGTPLAVASFGVAKMDRINQTYGYPAGDRILAQLGSLIGRTGRAEDLPARFGGDRFCIVINDASGREARVVAERIATIVTQTPLTIGAGQTLGIDLRTGVSELSHGDQAGSLIARAFDRMHPFGIRRAS